MNAAEVHDRQLEAIAAAVEQARTFAYLHGIGDRESRRALGGVVRLVRRCQSSVRPVDIVPTESSDGTASGLGADADKQVTPSASKELAVSVVPTTKGPS
jgi:hypothetical protein